MEGPYNYSKTRLEILTGFPEGAVRRNDVPGAPMQVSGTTWWDRFCFITAGFFACMWKGGGKRQGALLRQAMAEAYDDLNAPTFWKDRNPWGMLAGPLSSRRKGVRFVPEENADRAVYGGYLAAWMDRLEWDDKMGVAYKDIPDGGGYVRTYIDRVQLAGWFGRVNGVPIYYDWYTNLVASKSPGLFLPALRAKLLGTLATVLVAVTVLGVVAGGIWLLSQMFKRRKKS